MHSVGGQDFFHDMYKQCINTSEREGGSYRIWPLWQGWGGCVKILKPTKQDLRPPSDVNYGTSLRTFLNDIEPRHCKSTEKCIPMILDPLHDLTNITS